MDQADLDYIDDVSKIRADARNFALLQAAATLLGSPGYNTFDAVNDAKDLLRRIEA
jgi:hypothetical protein